MINTLQKFLSSLFSWKKKVTQGRLESNETDSRDWAIGSMSYSKTLKTEDLATLIDRKQLNEDFIAREKVKDPKSRKGISAAKAEIAALYSINRGLVQRHRGRIAFYRDDLTQKDVRSLLATGHAQGKFNEFKQKMDQ